MTAATRTRRRAPREGAFGPLIDWLTSPGPWLNREGGIVLIFVITAVGWLLLGRRIDLHPLSTPGGWIGVACSVLLVLWTAGYTLSATLQRRRRRRMFQPQHTIRDGEDSS